MWLSKPQITKKVLTGCLTGLIAIMASIMGCGYHFGARGRPVGIVLHSIAIPMMTSTSSELGFEADFTGIIRQEFISHAKVPILPSNEAQTVLTGHIYDIQTEPISFRRLEYEPPGQQPTGYRITDSRYLKVKLDIRFTDRTTGKTIWHESAMEEKARYSLTIDPLANRHNQQQALLTIARVMAKRIYLKTMERF
jgi:hypothetical protein